ncbi:fungal-specific transcription factor domain-containing protein [Penicillium angulare]|uniref:fungal-specific transcription factor domain-containing protein n=1 Tax=Penicillium angulare TaxID=116970 RepID=UPI00254128AA|nr:fungal-specific transcription factor domain-containing protein [Penicillium angulare]KAJ5290943.1 fungal-specific transcription factor domain-containing protein [Penicillium angulare]
MPPPRTESNPSTGAHGRQRPGAACDECRRRKLRCDGLQPQCGVCRETNVVCEVTKRAVRGPKKGHLKVLKNRILHLESMLETRLPDDQPHPQSEWLSDSRNSDDGNYGAASSGSEHEEALTSNSYEPQPTSNQSALQSSKEVELASFIAPASSPHLSTPIRAELDQLYMDRVHQSVPILHQRRYFSWSKSSKTASQQCLQYAMWTLASLLSVHSRELAEPLYRQTKQVLENLSIDADNEIGNSTALAQAWVLIIIFEYTRGYHRQAWMSAGRAFRLVQAMRYHEIDNPVDKRGPSSPQFGDLIEVEERRRVFWMSYFLDHIISIRDDWPITLNEHVICTRLPAPDDKFQNGGHELGPLLSEAMMEPTLQVQSSFNECLILATICGRSLLQSQQYHISKAYGDGNTDWSEQRRWLDSILKNRLQVLSQNYPAPTESNDPLLLFANILGQATVIYFCKTISDTSADDGSLRENSPEFIQYQYRALEASTNIISLASILQELPVSRVHPLTPIPLFMCAEFLYSEIHNEDFQPRLQELFHVFGGLKSINNPEQSYLDLLPRSCLSKTAELFIHSVGTGTPNLWNEGCLFP